MALVGLLIVAVAIFHFAVLSGIPADAPRQTAIADESFREPIDAARAALEPLSERFPSFSIAVGVDGRLVWSEARGWADLRRRTPARPQTLYRIYSVSKPITATVAALLAADGRLPLDAPIGSLLPDLPDELHPITPRQLAGHLGGIRHYREGEISAWGERHCDTVADALPFFLDEDPLARPPGETRSYSTYGYVLLSRVIEAATGRSYLETVDELLLRPAGMTETRLDDPRSDLPSRAEFYIPMWAGRVMADPDAWDNTCKWGGGGLLSTSEDLVRFGTTILGRSLLEPEWRQLLFTPMTAASGDETSSGFGFGLDTDDSGARIAYASGGAMGARAALHLQPDDGIVVAIVANMIGNRLTDEAADVGKSFAEWFTDRRTSR